MLPEPELDTKLLDPLPLDDEESLPALADDADLSIAEVRLLLDDSLLVVKPGVRRLKEYLALRSLDDFEVDESVKRPRLA